MLRLSAASAVTTAPSRAAGAHYPNFDAIRLVAASSVIFSHAFLISEGTEENEPLVRLLGAHNIAGIYGVWVFFIISGLLVTQSAIGTRSVPRFLWKRFLRIYPALIVCAVVCGVVLGAFFSSIGPKAYSAHLLGPRYAVLTAVLPSGSREIDTVSFYADASGPLGKNINGSLWTIPQEIICYLLIAVTAGLRLLRPWLVAVPAVGGAAFAFSELTTGYEFIDSFLLVAPAFFAGSTIALMRPGRPAMLAACGLCLVALVVAVLSGHLYEAFPVFGACPLLWLATSGKLRLADLSRIGDISYGAYLYGWPTEQVVRALLGGGARWWSVFLLSLPIALGLGFLSWRIIESRSLRLKGLGLPAPRGTVAEAPLSGETE
jgi:peptidoglycan/LPS O-acetylase OafA/YrhL